MQARHCNRGGKGRPGTAVSRKKPVNKVHLERVLGLTVTNNAGLSVDPNTGTVAYPAGCVVVLYNPKEDTQAHIISPERKTITCLAFSRDGKYLVTGESGHKPEVRVFKVDERSQYTSFKEHDIGINCVAFSPNRKYVVSVGCEHDKQIIVWDYRRKEKVAYNKVTSDIEALAFMGESKFVTVGKRHIGFWSMQTSNEREVVPLKNRRGNLGEQRDNTFCGVVCGPDSQGGSIFVITKSGLLCQINSARTLTRYVELGAEGAHSIVIGERCIFVGCAKGVVQVYDTEKLELVASMPLPHYLGVDVAAEPNHAESYPSNPQYPDTIALVLDDNNKLTCVYNDHSIYTYDMDDIKQATKVRSCMYHSQPIWGIEAYPGSTQEDQSVLPPSNSFITFSGDDTIRIWKLGTENNEKMRQWNSCSNELCKVIYTDNELISICKREFVPRERAVGNGEENGIRAMNVSPEGRFLASGDKEGNIRIYDLQTGECQVIMQGTDSNEVTSLQFCNTDTGVNLLAAAVHNTLYVFDVLKNYELIQTINDHSSTINAARFVELDGQIHLLSCGADKSIIFRSSQKYEDFRFQLNHQKSDKATLYDMDVDPTNTLVVTACQDRYVRIYEIRDGNSKKHYRGSQEDDGTLRTVVFDPSGTYIATSCSEKSLNIYDFSSGDCVATMSGHSELITGVMFSCNMRHLVSVSADGCIFIWKLPSEITENMKSRL